MNTPGKLARGGCVLCVLAVVSVVFGWGGMSTPAQAVDEPQSSAASLQLKDLSPLAPNRRSTLILSGRIANLGSLNLTELSVRVTISPEPLLSRDAIESVGNGDNSYDGFAIGQTTMAVTDVLAPGGREEFRLRVPIEQIPLPRAGVYVIGVQLVGVDPNVGYAVLAVARTLLPWLPDNPDAPLNLVWLWPLSTWPGRTADGVFLGDLMSREISSGGRLDRLLTIGTQAGDSVSWVLDPALAQSVRAMTDNYLVSSPDGITAGTNSAAASLWLEKFKDVADEHPFWSLPYADVDAEALLRGELERDVVRAITTAPSITRLATGSRPTNTIYWAPGGRLDAGTLNLLSSAGVSTVVLRSGALQSSPPVSFTPSGSVDIDTQFGPIRAAVIDSQLSGVLRMPQGNAADVLNARQRFVAETAFISLENPSLQRTLVMGPGDPQWRGSPRLLRGMLSALILSPWMNSATFTDLISDPPSSVPRNVSDYGSAQRERELSTEYVSRIQRAQESLGVLRSILDNPVDITEPISAALLRSGSAAWRTRPTNGVELLNSIQDALNTDIDKVAVVSRGTVTFSGDTGRVPITVANDFDQPISIGLRLVGQPAARLVSDDLDTVTIDGGKRASLEIPVRIVGGEPLAVTVEIISPDGQAFAEPGSLTLQTTAYSRAALWFSIAAALLLVILVIADTWRRSRQRRVSAETE